VKGMRMTHHLSCRWGVLSTTREIKKHMGTQDKCSCCSSHWSRQSSFFSLEMFAFVRLPLYKRPHHTQRNTSRRVVVWSLCTHFALASPAVLSMCDSCKKMFFTIQVQLFTSFATPPLILKLG
jgi:hypothetical protein